MQKAEGTTQISYSAYIPTGSGSVGVGLSSDDTRFNFYSYIDVDESDSNDITFRIANKTVTGTIKIPEEITLTNGVSYSVTAEYSYGTDNVYSGTSDITYGTIMKGETEKSYSVNVPENATLTALYVEVLASDNMPFVSNVYYSADGSSTTDYEELDIPIGTGLTDKDIELKTGRAILGTITLPSSADFYNNYYECYIKLNNGNDTIKKSFSLNRKTTDYMITVSDDFTGDFTLSYSTYSSDDLIYQYTFYYSENGAVLTNANAVKLNLDEKDTISGIDLAVPIITTINLTAHRPSYTLADTALKPFFTIILDNGDEIEKETEISANETESETEEITIPSIASTFKLRYEVDSTDDNYVYNYDNMYITSDGSATQDAEKAASYPVKDSNISFTVWDNSILINKAIADEDVELEVTEFSIDTENGTADAKISYSNAATPAYNAACVLAVYDEDGTFVRIDFKPILLSANTDEGEITKSFDITDDSDSYSYRLFVWNNINRITPLTQETVLSDEAE